jgi:hypothetical protein
METYMKLMEAVPTQVYLGAAVGSIALSAVLRAFGKKDAAIFVGQWPPTFILFALAYKMLRPSDGDMAQEGHQAVRHASDLIGANR